MVEPTVGAGVARTLVDYAVGLGADRRLLLGRAGIDSTHLQHQDGRLPFARYVRLLRAARELCHDDALALRFGEAVDLSQMSIVGVLDRGIETMADVFALINRYASLIMDTGGPAERLVVEHRPG